MKQMIATTLCKVAGHPGLRQRAQLLAESGHRSALLFWKCPRCSVEIRSIEIDTRHTNRAAGRREPAFE